MTIWAYPSMDLHKVSIYHKSSGMLENYLYLTGVYFYVNEIGGESYTLQWEQLRLNHCLQDNIL